MGASLSESRLLSYGRPCGGATAAERERTWPGDELVPHPGFVWTNAVTIEHPAPGVWAWVTQLGQGRADSTARYAPYNPAARYDTGHVLVLGGVTDSAAQIQAGRSSSSWAIIVEPVDRRALPPGRALAWSGTGRAAAGAGPVRHATQDDAWDQATSGGHVVTPERRCADPAFLVRGGGRRRDPRWPRAPRQRWKVTKRRDERARRDRRRTAAVLGRPGSRPSRPGHCPRGLTSARAAEE